jgi:peptidoglycan/xylan/chitin deacetylase (PgdA/CDA1 family)
VTPSPGPHGLRDRITRTLRRRLLPPRRVGVCLLYHRITTTRPDPWSLAVSPHHFAEHLDVLRRLGHPLRLGALLEAVRAGRVPRGAVAVSFDDGYADNLHAALPLLERYDVPATMFLTAGALGAEREFWWDELERVLLQPGRLPEALEVRVASGFHRTSLSGSTDYTDGHAAMHQHWRAGDAPPTRRHRAYVDLWGVLRTLDESDRRDALAALGQVRGIDHRARPTHRTLSSQEAAVIARHPLVDIGGHTITHPVLAGLPANAQRQEIMGGNRMIEAIVGRPVTTFAYPFGKESDYTPETVRLVRETGSQCGCTNVSGVTTPATDPYRLPRMYVHDWDGDTFGRRLADRLRSTR